MWRVWAWCRSGSRWCGAGVLWTFLVGLTILAVVQVMVLAALRQVEEVTAPDWVAERLNRELAAYGWQASWERLGFDLRGYLRIAGLRLHDVRLGESLLEAHEVRLDVDFSALLGGQLMLDGFRLEGAKVTVPTMISPTGQRIALVERLMTTGFRRGHRWHINHAQAKVGAMTVRAVGVVPIHAPVERRPPPQPEQVRQQVLALLAKGGGAMPWLAEAGAWHWRIEAATDGQEQVRLAATGMLGHIETRGFSVQGVTLSVPDLIPETGLMPQGVRVSWRRAQGPAEVSAGAGSLRLRLGRLGEPWPWRQAVFEVSDLRHPWVQVDGATGRIDLSAWPVLVGDLAVRMQGRQLKARASFDTEAWSGGVNLDSHLDLGAWLGAAPLPVDLAQYFQFGGPPRLRATAILGPGGRPERIEVAGDLPQGGTVLGWVIDRMSGRAVWDGRMLRAEELVVENPGYRAEGSYEEDLVTRAYRLRAKGTLRPDDLNPLFGSWWDNIWPQFTFNAAPEIDLAIAGWWNGSDERYIWGVVGADNTGFREVPLDRIDARLRVEENYVDLYRLRGRGAMGELEGELQFLLYPHVARMVTTRLAIQARAALGAVGQIAGPEVASILRDFTPEGFPTIDLLGWFHEGRVESWRKLEVQAETSKPIAYRGIGLESLQLSLLDWDGELILDPIVAGFAGGRGHGSARFSGLGGPDPRLRVQLALDETGYGPTLDLLRGLHPVAPEAADVAAPASREAPPPDEPGRIKLTFAGEGRADEIASFTGSGDYSVKGADFAHVQVFGDLSRLFEGSFIGFSTIRLADAQGTYRLALNEISFPDLALSGPLSRASARGTMARIGGELDFRVRVYLLDESSNVFSGLLQPVFRPLGRILELRLRGTLDKPDWRLMIDPRNLFGGGGPPPTDLPPAPPNPAP